MSSLSQYSGIFPQTLTAVAMFVATSMAEILSALPTSGGPYFWAYMLSPQQHAPFFAWITGW